MSSFMQRVLSALLLIPLVFLAIWLGGFLFKAFIAIVMLVAFYEFFMMARLEASLGVRYGLTILCALYCIVGFVAAISLNISFILVILLCVWASDSGAYFVGKALKGPKLAPAFSPNKTISGLVGACLAPFIVLLIMMPQSPTHILFMYGVMIGVIGQAGDIMISMLKRRVGVKDTGNIIPGHGGILDRIDALILVLIVFWIGLESGIVIWQNEALLF